MWSYGVILGLRLFFVTKCAYTKIIVPTAIGRPLDGHRTAVGRPSDGCQTTVQWAWTALPSDGRLMAIRQVCDGRAAAM